MPSFRPVLLSLVFLAGISSGTAVCGSPFEKALSATVRLTAEGVSGTGFLVRKGDLTILVTAGHVFQDFKGGQCDLVYRRKQEDKNPTRHVLTLTIREEEKPLWQKHAKFDLAMLPIDLPEDAALEPFPLERIAKAEEIEEGVCGVGDEVCIPCYPIGTEANPAGWPILRRGTIATHPLAPVAEAETFFIDSSCFGGESGAPVVFWSGDDWRVIGIVTSMQRQTDRTVTPLEERVSHLPLGLGIALQSAFLVELLTDE